MTKVLKEKAATKTTKVVDDDFWHKLNQRMHEIMLEVMEEQREREEAERGLDQYRRYFRLNEPTLTDLIDPANWYPEAMIDTIRSVQLARKIERMVAIKIFYKYFGYWAEAHDFVHPEDIVTDLFEAEDFAVDLMETEEMFILVADLPDVAQKDIKVTYVNNVLKVTVKRPTTEVLKNKQFLLKEIKDEWVRSFKLKKIVKKQIVANFKNGRLQIMMPKEQTAKDDIILVK